MPTSSASLTTIDLARATTAALLPKVDSILAEVALASELFHLAIVDQSDTPQVVDEIVPMRTDCVYEVVGGHMVLDYVVIAFTPSLLTSATSGGPLTMERTVKASRQLHWK
ncbi:hypothetical protein EJ03DRAFT_337211 [Teratosphaeria nubilosa]|uniref:Uncharacterized protein n=1 Tax=Teratosphaeria nubilosa TaxID=161662 RepID=A0A6G1L696_9PEZI|nr:hypothetical protein EJ03DRAFT_337211 [Teratosphaeria nubilosa]